MSYNIFVFKLSVARIGSSCNHSGRSWHWYNNKTKQKKKVKEHCERSRTQTHIWITTFPKINPITIELEKEIQN